METLNNIQVTEQVIISLNGIAKRLSSISALDKFEDEFNSNDIKDELAGMAQNIEFVVEKIEELSKEIKKD